MLNPVRDKNEGKYEGGEVGAPIEVLHSFSDVSSIWASLRPLPKN